MPGLISFERLLVDIDNDPIAGAETAQRRHGLGVRNATYESSVSAGALYRAMKGKPGLVNSFYRLPFWSGDDDKKSYVKNSKHLNKHCHQFVYDARAGSEGKRAEDHASATQSYYDDESKTLDQILEALKKGGFDSLKKAAPARAQKTRSKKTETDAQKRSSAESSSKRGSGGEDAPEKERSSNGDKDPPQLSLPELTKEGFFDCLLLTVEPEELALFLDDGSKVGDRYLIEVQREADDAEGVLVWRAIEITKMDDEE